MPNLKVTDTPTRPRALVGTRRATAADVGGSGEITAATGQTLTAISDKLAAAQQRVDDRNDTVARSRSYNTYSQQVSDETLRFQTEGDITDQQQLTEYGVFLKDRAQEAISNHTGSAESLSKLTIRLEAMQAEATQRMGVQSNTAGRAMVSENMNTNIAAIATRAGVAGDIQTGFDSVDAEVIEAAAALTPAEEAAARNGGRASVITSVFNNRMDQEDIEGAELVLSTPGIETMFKPEDLRKMRAEITTQKRAAEKGRREGEQEIEKTETILGRKVTDAERVRLAGLAPTVGAKTLQDKVDEFTTVFERPPTEAEMSRMAGTTVTEPAIFGGGAPGLALARITDDATAFGAGMLSAEDDNRYVAAFTRYMEPVTTVDPTTGITETRRPELPAFVREALTRRGIPIPGVIATEGEVPPPGAPLDIEAELPEQTIFDMAPLVTGPVSTMAETAGQMPIVGEVIRPERIETARSSLRLMVNQLVSVLQKSPRFNEGERQAIKEDLSISPEFFDTAGAFQSRVIGVDDALVSRIKQAEAVMNSEISGKAERVQAMREVNAMRMFRIQLGAPPLMKTPEEAGKLPEGATFRTPDGRILVNKKVVE